MQIIALDFETYFDSEYTLKKLTTEAYIRDSRFEAHGLAVKLENQPAAWSRDPPQLDWADTAVIVHHAHFDGLILSHHYGIKPALWIDTLSMARVVFDSSVRNSLESLAQRFNLEPKSVPYSMMQGYHWGKGYPHGLISETQLQEAIARGCCNDVELTWSVANYLLNGHPAFKYPFPKSELKVVDLTVRMFTEPVLSADILELQNAYEAEERARQELFTELNVTGEMLRQDETFANLLRDEGVEIELKTTAKGNEKYPFAKTDRFMQELAEVADERISALVEGRLLAHSSIYQTRALRLGWAASRGLLPVYLSYCAAHTRRWGGGDKMNWQNFPRPDEHKPNKGALRRAIKI